MDFEFKDDVPWYKRLLLLRTDREKTQQDMAEALSVEHRRYWGWEKGQTIPREDYQSKIAAALDVDPAVIFGGPHQDFTGLARKEK